MSDDRTHDRMKDRAHGHGHERSSERNTERNHESRTAQRARRARVLVVGHGEAMRDLAAHARRKVAHVIEVATLYDAVDECRRAPAAEPIAAAFISPDCEQFDAAAVVDAFMRVDPALPLVLAVRAAQDDLTAESISEGFEDSIRLPVRDDELARILDDVGATEHTAPAPTAPAVPAPKNVVEEIVERAHERLQARDVDRVGDRVSDRAVDRGTEQVVERPHERSQERSQERPHERAQERAHDKPLEKPLDKPIDRTLDRGLDRGHDRTPFTTPTPATTREQPTRAATRGAPLVPFQMPSTPRRSGNHPPDAPPSDLDLVRAVMDGHDVQGAAMRVLRHHLGSADVRFVAEPRPGEEAAVELDRRGLRQVEVLRHPPSGAATARPYGALISRTIDESHLRAWADWLSAWLDLDEQHHELRRLAWTDELTGAGNRRAFDKLLADTIQAAQRDWRFFGLMLFDIDDFKRYNDEYGHDTGDEVLKEIVELLRICIRRGDHIFRIGGDEFAVLFCDPEGPRRGGTLDRESATAIANRFQRAVAELSLTHIGLDGPGTVSVSTGFASFPWHGLDPLALYRAADGFCLDSKRAGKNRITFGPGVHPGSHGEGHGAPHAPPHGPSHGPSHGGSVQ